MNRTRQLVEQRLHVRVGLVAAGPLAFAVAGLARLIATRFNTQPATPPVAQSDAEERRSSLQRRTPHGSALNYYRSGLLLPMKTAGLLSTAGRKPVWIHVMGRMAAFSSVERRLINILIAAAH